MRDLAKIMLDHYDFMKTTKKAGVYSMFLCGGFNFEVKLNMQHKKKIQKCLSDLDNLDFGSVEEILLERDELTRMFATIHEVKESKDIARRSMGILKKMPNMA
jgi:hypothetical protein